LRKILLLRPNAAKAAKTKIAEIQANTTAITAILVPPIPFKNPKLESEEPSAISLSMVSSA